MLNTQEHIDLIAKFERDMKRPEMPYIGRLDKEDRELWAKGHIYQDGAANQIFLAYRAGYAYGKCYERNS